MKKRGFGSAFLCLAGALSAGVKYKKALSFPQEQGLLQQLPNRESPLAVGRIKTVQVRVYLCKQE